MIKRFTAKGLNNHIDCDLIFHSDLNILTGRNGSGKTTILKIIWYLISGNIERIPREVTFEKIRLSTSDFTIAISKRPKSEKEKQHLYDFGFTKKGKKRISKQLTIANIEDEAKIVHDANWQLSALRPSLFFPTFRRIEGGYSFSAPKRRRPGSPDDSPQFRARHTIDLQEPLEELSDHLSVNQNRFVTSISTHDIISLLTKKYASITESTERINRDLSKDIFSLIGKYEKTANQSESKQLSAAKKVLDKIAFDLAGVNTIREELFTPFTILSRLVEQIFHNKGIQITENITLGKSTHGTDSDILSSGEKQMLSFLCYNAFTSEIPIFIDEPEISLHTDWQRILLPTLLEQATGNQFIVATHSPFIYTKYPDKELNLDLKRGG